MAPQFINFIRLIRWYNVLSSERGQLTLKPLENRSSVNICLPINTEVGFHDNFWYSPMSFVPKCSFSFLRDIVYERSPDGKRVQYIMVRYTHRCRDENGLSIIQRKLCSLHRYVPFVYPVKWTLGKSTFDITAVSTETQPPALLTWK